MSHTKVSLRAAVRTTVQLALPQGLRVFVVSEDEVADSLARMLLAATYVSAQSYEILVTLNLAADALVYLNRSFSGQRPELDVLRAAIQSSIDDGELIVTQEGESLVGQDSKIRHAHWVTPGRG